MKNLFQRILSIVAEAEKVIKDTKVGFGNTNYMGISHDAVIETIRPLCVTHGVVVMPSIESYTEDEIETSRGGTSYKVTATVVTTFINADNPEERFTVRTIGTGMDAQDKAPGKAMSYAKKYGVLYAFLLLTSDGDELRPDFESRGAKRNARPAQRPSNGQTNDGKPSDRQKQFAWTLIQKLPTGQQQEYIDQMKACTGQEASDLIDKLKLMTSNGEVQ